MWLTWRNENMKSWVLTIEAEECLGRNSRAFSHEAREPWRGQGIPEGNAEFEESSKDRSHRWKNRADESSQRDKFIEVDNCISPGTLQEHIRLLEERDFGISLPSGRLPEDVVSCRQGSVARKDRFGYWNNALLSLLLSSSFRHCHLAEPETDAVARDRRKQSLKRACNETFHPLMSLKLTLSFLFVEETFMEW